VTKPRPTELRRFLVLQEPMRTFRLIACDKRPIRSVYGRRQGYFIKAVPAMAAASVAGE